MAEAAHRYPGARNPDFRRVLVTGALGKVGVRVVQAFHADKSGKPWEVVSTDVARGVFVRAAIFPRSCRTSEDASGDKQQHQTLSSQVSR